MTISWGKRQKKLTSGMILVWTIGGGASSCGGDGRSAATQDPPGTLNAAGGNEPSLVDLTSKARCTEDHTKTPQLITSLPPIVSGSRLKAKRQRLDEQNKAFVGWYDQKLQTDCLFRRTSSTSWRCLPFAGPAAPLKLVDRDAFANVPIYKTPLVPNSWRQVILRARAKIVSAYTTNAFPFAPDSLDCGKQEASTFFLHRIKQIPPPKNGTFENIGSSKDVICNRREISKEETSTSYSTRS